MVKGRALWHHFMLRMSISETRPGGDPGGPCRSASREWGSAPNSEPSALSFCRDRARVGSNAVSIVMQGGCRHTYELQPGELFLRAGCQSTACRRQ
jgi:hypothetical protein